MDGKALLPELMLTHTSPDELVDDGLPGKFAKADEPDSPEL